MASSPSPSPSPEDTVPEDNDVAELPMTMAASVVLEQLPRDAHKALETAGEIELEKENDNLRPCTSTSSSADFEPATVTIHLKPLPNTPQLRQPRFKCSSNNRFEAIVRFLRKRLAVKDHESVFCYINSVFAPGLDEGVGNLWRCFKVGDELVVSYSITQAFG